MLKISCDFSINYGLAFSTLAEERDYAHFNPTEVNLASYLEGGAKMIEEEAGEYREMGLVRAWLEFLIAATNSDIEALGFRNSDQIADIVLPIPGADLQLEEWHHVLEWMRQRVFHLDAPMTDEEKAKAKLDVTIIDEPLSDFRARMRAEGRLDPE